MAEGLNKVILIGNVGTDPELRFTQNGQAILRLRLATSESYVDRNKERQERTEWHTVIVWGNRAEALNKIITKGRELCIEGRLQTRQWEDKDGGKRSTTEVVATNVVLLRGGGNQGQRQDQRPSGDPYTPSGGGDYTDQFSDNPDDIPF